MNKDTAPDLTSAGTFRHWTPVSLRFSDQDSMGHINNVAYAAYVEQSRVAFLDDFLRSQGGGGIDYILASVNLDYRREMHFPGNVDIGARLMRIGTKSITTAYGLFKDGENVATAGSVNVFFDPQLGKTIPIPEDLKKILEAESAKG
ncbi:MAG TPA: thioesterase family protein [Rhodospirillales bacterium]|jgi:acyl-CoA thioester hydrolase|nr:thioesterase family protein [Rhodospirillales bacterium]